MMILIKTMMLLMKIISGGKVQSLIDLQEFPTSEFAIITCRLYNNDDDEPNLHGQLNM